MYNYLNLMPKQGAVSQQVHVAAGCSVVVIGRKGRSFAHSSDNDAVLVAAIAALLVVAATAVAAGQQTQHHDCGQEQAQQTQFSVSHNVSPHVTLFDGLCRLPGSLLRGQVHRMIAL